MKINGANRGSGLTRMLKTLGILGVVGMAGAIVVIAPLAGGGCSDSTGGAGGGAGTSGLGGAGGVAGTGGIAGTGGVAGVDAGADATVAAAAALQITIQNFMYSPANLTVAPGATVSVHNADTIAHTATSEAAWGNFTPGAVSGISFDTGPIAAGASATITVPATAAVGTVIPYFCTIHGRTMGQGMITVQ